MKISILLTLLITIAVFSYVSGYSIGAHHNRYAAETANRKDIVINATATATAAENSPAAPGGYGVSSPNTSSSPGYGGSSPGYGR